MELLEKIEILLSYYKKGLLGGEFMPEDENPNLIKHIMMQKHVLYLILKK